MSAAEPIRVRVRRLPEGRDLPLPAQATPGSAGFDLRARLTEAVTIAPGARHLIPTGISLALPEDCVAEVRPRSGLALKTGMTLLNSPGTVDSDYRGEVAVIAINLGSEPLTLRRGDRVAQLVIQRLPQVVLEEVDELSETTRGSGGFGHSGSA